MIEMVLETKTLPTPLLRLIRTSKVKVWEFDGEVRLTPIIENKEGCPLLGVANDCGFTVDDFLARKREEKRLESE